MAKIQGIKKAPSGAGSFAMGVAGPPTFAVFMNFEQPTHGLTFTPEQAQGIGVSLIEFAARSRAMAQATIATPQVVKSRSN